MAGPRIEGLTAIGRATVLVLGMNDARRLDLRAELLARRELACRRHRAAMLSGWFVRPDGSKRPLRHRFMERRFTGVITSTPVASPGLLPYSLTQPRRNPC